MPIPNPQSRVDVDPCSFFASKTIGEDRIVCCDGDLGGRRIVSLSLLVVSRLLNIDHHPIFGGFLF